MSAFDGSRNRLVKSIAFDKAIPAQRYEQALPSSRKLRREKERRERKERSVAP